MTALAPKYEDPTTRSEPAAAGHQPGRPAPPAAILPPLDCTRHRGPRVAPTTRPDPAARIIHIMFV